MNRLEFEERIKPLVINDCDFDAIQQVYTFHPAISDTQGKEQIAALYKIGGMGLILSMVPDAQTAQELEGRVKMTYDRYLQAQTDLSEFKDKFRPAK